MPPPITNVEIVEPHKSIQEIKERGLPIKILCYAMAMMGRHDNTNGCRVRKLIFLIPRMSCCWCTPTLVDYRHRYLNTSAWAYTSAPIDVSWNHASSWASPGRDLVVVTWFEVKPIQPEEFLAVNFVWSAFLLIWAVVVDMECMSVASLAWSGLQPPPFKKKITFSWMHEWWENSLV